MLCLGPTLTGNALRQQVTLNPNLTGTWVALKFASLIDPALQYDVYCEKPWFLSPLLCAMNVVNVAKASTPVANSAPTVNGKVDAKFKPQPSQFTSGTRSKIPADNASKNTLADWNWADDHTLQEDTKLLIEDSKAFPSDGVAERRKYYQKPKHRQATMITPDKIYNMEV
jgi:Protein of unknown function (DUF1769)